jgi:predicted NBD/HSP70 family sugar kinase
MLRGHDTMLAVDIGGSNIRAGIVALRHSRRGLVGAAVVKGDRWRYRNAQPTRDDAVAGLASILKKLIRIARRRKHRLAPFIGVGCPGVIAADGSIERGGQNLPGNWQTDGFNLPREIAAQMPLIGGEPAKVVLHNDAVVQGLSELPWMRDVAHWGVLTIGTGLGNAHFTNRRGS